MAEPYSSQELRNLAARASIIDERMAGGYVAMETPYSADRVARRTEDWCKSAADGDHTLFRKRLARDGLDLDTVEPLLGDVRLAEDQPTPEWVRTFCWAVEAMESPDDTNASVPYLDADSPLPFEDLFVPLAGIARQRRDRLAGDSAELLSETAHAALQRHLLRRSSELCAPTLHEGFTLFQMVEQPMTMALALPTNGDPGSRVAYDAYIAELRGGGLRDYFLSRPVLARLLATVTRQWIEATAELIARLGADLTAIGETFHSGARPGQVADVDYGLSDPHNGGRTVCILAFASQLKVVYKPKDLGLDVAWRGLLQTLDTLGAPPSARAPGVLQRNGHGWAEWIEPVPCTDEAEARRFFRRGGSMLCLVHLLQGTDFHYENVIATGDEPVLVDLETMMHPRLTDPYATGGPEAAPAAAVAYLRDSVLATGYLPNWLVVPGGRIVAVGGLNPPELGELERWTFQDVNTDGMKLENASEETPTKSNLPTLEGEQLSVAAYGDDVVAGFEAMSRFLLAHRSALAGPAGSLAAFRGQTVRVVLRATRLYALLLRRSQESVNLSDGVDWSLHFDFLARLSKLEEGEDLLWSVQASERDCLARLDIPFFATRTDTDGLRLPDGRTVSNCFEGPSFTQTIQRLRGIGETASQTQVSIIRQSIENAGGRKDVARNETWRHESRAQIDGGGLTPGIAVDQARVFAAVLEREAFRRGGGAAWVGAVPLPGEGRVQLEVIGHGLYSGASGVALFLAALDRVTGTGGYRDLALAALHPLRNELRSREGGLRLARGMGIGGGAGLGSVIYALVRIASLLDEGALMEDAGRAAALITSDRIAADRTLDVMAGAAGAILGLLALYRACHDDLALELATACGHPLLAKQGAAAAGGRAWRTIGDTLLTGFSHGAAGIGYALLKLYEATADRAILAAALDGLGYERGAFSVEEGNWPDLREFPGSGGGRHFPANGVTVPRE